VKQTSPFKSAGASVKSTTGSRVVRISGSNAGYTMLRGSVASTGYPLHSPVSPSLPLPCVTMCHHISTGPYLCVTTWDLLLISRNGSACNWRQFSFCLWKKWLTISISAPCFIFLPFIKLEKHRYISTWRVCVCVCVYVCVCACAHQLLTHMTNCHKPSSHFMTQDVTQCLTFQFSSISNQSTSDMQICVTEIASIQPTIVIHYGNNN